MTDELNHYGLKVHRFGAKAPPWTSHGLKAAVLKVRSFDYNALRALKRAGTVNHPSLNTGRAEGDTFIEGVTGTFLRNLSLTYYTHSCQRPD